MHLIQQENYMKYAEKIKLNLLCTVRAAALYHCLSDTRCVSNYRLVEREYQFFFSNTL